MSINNLHFILHSSQLRQIQQSEGLAVVTQEEQALPRTIHEVDTSPFEADVIGGIWDRSSNYLWDQATSIRTAIDESGALRVLYFGLAEVPHIIALGAYLGDERYIEVFGSNRSGSWEWPQQDKTLELECLNLPAEKILSTGIAVVRVELSFAIADSDIDAVVGPNRLADITIRPSNNGLPDVGIVQSSKDVEQVRTVFRSALAAIRNSRPEAELLHLFVAAPAPVCFAIGQELRLRNSFPVQTYRFRKGQVPAYQDAILLSAGDVENLSTPLSAEQVALAERVRSEIWPKALNSVQHYAVSKKRDAGKKKAWYDELDPSNHLSKIKPFPPLPPIWEAVDERDTVDPQPYNGDFGRDKDNHTWRANDRLLIGLSESAQGDEDRLQQLIRLFLFHEYLHDYHVLTKYTAAEVGKYANCLERIDYMADLYALLHQLDLAWREDMKPLKNEDDQQRFLANQIDLVIRSFWAFEPEGPLERWQVRRVRRYLNWYWRYIQVLRAKNLVTALRVLSKPPVIELAGLQHRTDGRRIYMMMNRLDPTTDLGLGLVLENERLMRIANSTTTNLHEVMEAFRTRNHEAIQQFFRSVYEEANAQGGAFPT